jgi:anti-sigma regulatory factor (Ser/Thr protein kinase)
MSKAVATRPDTRVFTGSPAQVRQVRDFVGHLVAGCPMADEIVLLTSELATNAIVHTASAGGPFIVAVRQAESLVRVEVCDAGSATIPIAQPLGDPEESGCGLALVEKLATSWGYFGGPQSRVVWFEMEWE